MDLTCVETPFESMYSLNKTLLKNTLKMFSIKTLCLFFCLYSIFFYSILYCITSIFSSVYFITIMTLLVWNLIKYFKIFMKQNLQKGSLWQLLSVWRTRKGITKISNCILGNSVENFNIISFLPVSKVVRINWINWINRGRRVLHGLPPCPLEFPWDFSE